MGATIRSFAPYVLGLALLGMAVAGLLLGPCDCGAHGGHGE
jgi:hypothetical protein